MSVDSFLKSKVSRRTLLSGMGAAAAASTIGGVFPMPAIAKETTWTLANSMRSLANPYHATFAKGGADFAKSIDAKYESLVTEGNSEKGISDIKALLQRTGGKLILNVDPNDSPDARVIVEECKKAGAYVVTQWNKPADLHPWDFNPNYVAHMSFDGVPTAKAIAPLGSLCAPLTPARPGTKAPARQTATPPSSTTGAASAGTGTTTVPAELGGSVALTAIGEAIGAAAHAHESSARPRTVSTKPRMEGRLSIGGGSNSSAAKATLPRAWRRPSRRT
jgi:hypothetical protein